VPIQKTIVAVLVAAVALSGALLAESRELARARVCYRHGDFVGTIKLLEAAGVLDAEGLLLAGQAHYRAGNIRVACDFFQRAVAANPAASRYVHWLGRAYGRRAASANVLLAPKYAVLARQSFEEAVRLDPKNVEAWNDLFNYFIEAPRFLGGGLDKAAGVADRVLGLDAAEYHYDRARLAEKQKQPKLAEHHYRMAAEQAPQDPGRLIDLAEFLESQGRAEAADRAFDRAHEVAPGAPVVLYERARTYVQSRRRLDDARTLLNRYLSTNAGPDDPPRSEALKLLKRLPSVSALNPAR
jgi:tetratricopeptide (TPR) repeat protein